MMSVGQALEKLAQTLELTGPQRAEAIRQHTVVREHLRQALTLENDFLSGSYARKTAIRPLNDIDLFVVLSGRAHGELRTKPSGETLRTIQAVLDAAYPTKEHPVLQGRSVGIEFAGTGIAYDVVPAFRIGPEVYEIPNRKTGAWIRTNPRTHKELATAANQAAGKKLKPLFKMVKHWRNLQGRPGRSFHLEVLSWSAFRGEPSSYLVGLCQLFEHLARNVGVRCPDPAGLGPAVDDGIEANEREMLRTKLREAHALASEAQALAAKGRTGEAHAKLKALFGAEYPEKGRKAPAIVPVAGGTPDTGSGRFG